MQHQEFNPDESLERVIGVFGLRYAPETTWDRKSREDFSNANFVEETLHSTAQAAYEVGCELMFIAGGSRGVEMIAERWALTNGHKFERIRPHRVEGSLDVFGIRNQRIIERCTDFIVFWDGADLPIGRIIREATCAGKVVSVIPVL